MRKKLIVACLDSLAAQEPRPDEILIVNNASTDRTEELVKQFMAAHPEVNTRLIQETKQGCHHARETGWREAMGDIIIHVDADEILPPGWLARIRTTLMLNPTIDAIGGTVRFDKPPFSIWFMQVLFNLFYSRVVQMSKGFPYMCGGMTITKREVLQAMNGYADKPDNELEDYYFSKQAHRLGYTLRYIPQIYGIHSLRRYEAGGLRGFLQWGVAASMPRNTMPMSVDQQPSIIPLNAGDKLFLIPETDNSDGTHFPMSLIVCASLRRAVTLPEVGAAVSAVNRRFPQFRLGYRLDPFKDRLVRVAEGDLESYLASLVQPITFNGPLEAALAALLSVNNTPISQPVLVTLHQSTLIMRMHHSFGDGKFLFHLLATVLSALLTPQVFEVLADLPPHYGLTLWQLIAQTPGQRRRVFGKWLQTLRGSVQEYQRDTTVLKSNTLDPIRSGSSMSVQLRTLPPPVMRRLNSLRQRLATTEKISLNTLLQVLFAKCLCDMGLIRLPAIYSIPVDLHRYLPNPDTFYPGNLASQIRVAGRPVFDLQEEAQHLQQQIQAQLDALIPLAMVPSEWLLMAAGRKTYKKRESGGGLNASINNDPRFFILTNLGALDDLFAPVVAHLERPAGVFLLVPLMGRPPLVISVNTLHEQTHLALTYDPRVLSDAHMDTLFQRVVDELVD
ncbi:glycosyltransferase [bacterium]|nr:glycosyltransferase [bacterium]